MKDATIVWPKLFLILIISTKPLGLKASYDDCKQLGYNSCMSDNECCSGYCHREPAWIVGECKKISSAQSSLEEPAEVFEKGSCKYYKGRKISANGEIHNKNEMTAAHETLPFNTKVKVDVMGSSVVVKITDRKNNMDGQVLLMSFAAADRVDILDKDSVPCQLTVVNNVGCIPDFGGLCLYNQDCCSGDCFRAMFSEGGFCQPS